VASLPAEKKVIMGREYEHFLRLRDFQFLFFCIGLEDVVDGSPQDSVRLPWM